MTGGHAEDVVVRHVEADGDADFLVLCYRWCWVGSRNGELSNVLWFEE